MFTEKERKSIEQIHMSDEQTNTIWDQVITHTSKQKATVKKLALAGISALIVSLFLPPVRSFAEEVWKNSWFYSEKTVGNNDSILQEGEWIVFSSNTLKENREFTSIGDISDMLEIPLLYSTVYQFDTISYKPSFNENDELVAITLWGSNRMALTQTISKETLLSQFTKELSEKQRQEIDRIYELKQEDIAGYYSQALTYYAALYGEKSNVTGDIRTMPTGNDSIDYYSDALACNVIIEKQLRQDGTYRTYATWIKDNIVYSISGYYKTEDMKRLLETMRY